MAVENAGSEFDIRALFESTRRPVELAALDAEILGRHERFKEVQG